MVKLNVKKRIIGAMILAMTLSGCGEPQKEKIAEEYDNNTSDISDLETSSGENDDQKHVEFEAADKSGKCIIKANVDIDLMGYNSADAYAVEDPVIDDSFVLDLAAKLFDNGIYTVEKPYGLLSPEELKSERDNFDEKINAMNTEDKSVKYEIFQYDEVDYYLMSMSDEDLYDDYRENAMVKEGGAFYEYDDMGECRLRGNIDGEYCELRASKGNNLINVLSLEPHPIEIYSTYQVHDENEQYFDENKMSKEDAELVTGKILSRLGKTEYEKIRCVPISVGNDDMVTTTEFGSKVSVNGYNSVYAIAKNGLCGGMEIFTSTPEEDLEDDEFFDYVNQDYIDIMVDDMGIRQIILCGMYDVGTSVSKEVKMLGIDQVIESLKGDWIKKDRSVRWGSLKYNVESFELKYMIMQYDGKYTMVPTWILELKPENVETANRMKIAINSLDGSVKY